VGDGDFVHPVKVSVHGGGGEIVGSPFFHVMVDAFGASGKGFLRGKEFSVVFEAVDADLKAAAFEVFDEVQGDFAVAFRNEVEAGAEAQAFFEGGEFFDISIAFYGVHVVDKDQGELFAVGPAGPAFGFLGGGRVDGPDCGAGFKPPGHDPSAQGKLQGPGDEGPQGVEDGVAEG